MVKRKSPKEYITIYVTRRDKKLRYDTEEQLEAADCNFSRILGVLFVPIFKLCKIIAALGKNYRHFKWDIIVKDRASGSYYCSNDRIQIREVKK